MGERLSLTGMSFSKAWLPEVWPASGAKWPFRELHPPAAAQPHSLWHHVVPLDGVLCWFFVPSGSSKQKRWLNNTCISQHLQSHPHLFNPINKTGSGLKALPAWVLLFYKTNLISGSICHTGTKKLRSQRENVTFNKAVGAWNYQY